MPSQNALAEKPKVVSDTPKPIETQPKAKIIKPKPTIAKANAEILPTQRQDSIINVDNLVVYQADNLVEYVKNVDYLVVYEVDNLVEYDTTGKESFIEQKLQQLNALTQKGKEAYDFLYAKVKEEKRKLFNI
ncbi:MAG: hypothetical protein LBR28_00060 [Bacteroidales bacterium]|jgi:hypothetical protein|nr:hypothetical protein [Bacteroidales bacterium]